MAKLFELYAELGLDAAKFNTGVDKATKQGGNLAKSLKSGIGDATSAVGNGVKATTIMMGNLMSSAVKKGASLVKSLVSTGIDYNSTMETYVTNFTTMLNGSSEAAKKLTSDIESMAASTPFAMSDLADASQTLLAFGQDSGTVLDTLQSLGDIAMGDANKLSSLTLAFAQASSSGKLMGQDLMQMINAGFNPLQTIVDKTGASMGDLKDFMSNGKASSDLKKQMRSAQQEVKKMGTQASDGAKLLAQMAEEGAISAETLGMIFDMETSPGGRYYNAMENASKTFKGMLSTLQDDSAALLGRVFKPVSDYIQSELMPKASQFITNVNKGFDVGGIKGAWSAAIGTVRGYLSDIGSDALDAGSNLLANILNGLTGSQTTGAEISALISGVWDDAKSGLDTLLSAGSGLLQGIYTGLTGDNSKQSIIDTVDGLWDSAKEQVTSFISSAGGVLGSIYTSITGQETTADNIGKTIGGIFSAANTARSELLDACSTFFTELNTKLGDPDATTGEKIAGVFSAGSTAISNLLESAGGLFTNLYAKITGDTEGADDFKAYMSGVWDDAKAGLGSISEMGGSILGGIYEGLINDTETRSNIVEFFSDMFKDISEGTGEFGKMLKTVYTELTGKEATPQNIQHSAATVASRAGQSFGGLAQIVAGEIDFLTNIPGLVNDLHEASKSGSPWEQAEKGIIALGEAVSDPAGKILGGAGRVIGGIAGWETVEDFEDAMGLRHFGPGVQKLGPGHYTEDPGILAGWQKVQENNAFVYKNQTDLMRILGSMYASNAEYGLSETQIDALMSVIQAGKKDEEYFSIAKKVQTAYETKDSGALADVAAAADAAAEAAAAAQEAANAAAAVAASIGSITVEMDGQTVGELVTPIVASGLARLTRVAGLTPTRVGGLTP